MPKKISDVALRHAKAHSVIREQGIEWRFHATGRAGVRWIGRLQGSNKRVSLSLGQYPELSLSEARTKAEEARKLAQDGIDPRHTRRERAEAQQRTVAIALEGYLGGLENRPSTMRDKHGTLKAGLRSFAKLPIGNVTKLHVIEALEAYSNRPATRRKLAAYANHFFRWCGERDLISQNPLAMIRKPRPVPPRDRYLNDNEIRALMTCEAPTIWLPICQLVLLTGQRSGEIRHMRMSDLDLRRREWTIPRHVFKQGRPHTVPLSSAALAIIRRTIEKRATDTGPYIFSHSGERPFGKSSDGMASILAATNTAGWASHDCRRTWTTIMQRLGVPRELRKTVQGHAVAHDAASAYEKHDFREEGRLAMQLLADHIQDIVAGKQPRQAHSRRPMSRWSHLGPLNRYSAQE